MRGKGMRAIRLGRGISAAISVVLGVWMAFGQSPPTEQSSILVTISPDRAIVAVGDVVHCDFTIENTGDLTVDSLTLVDDFGNSIPLDDTELAIGELAHGAFDYTVTEAYLPGPFEIRVTASGWDPYGREVVANAYSRIPMAAVTLAKEAGTQAAEPGTAVTYTFTVTNSGSSTLILERIEDDRLGTIDLGGAILAPGASTNVTSLPYTLPDDPSGVVVNTATVYAHATEGDDTVYVDDTDTASVRLVHVRLEKSVTPTEAYPGQQVTFTVTVHNDDNFTWNLHLSDPLLSFEQDLVLGPGETWTQDFPYTIPAGAPDPLVNVAILTEPGVWEMTAEAQVKVLQAGDPGPHDPEDPRNQPWDVSLAVVKVFDTQVFDGERFNLRILNGIYEPVVEIAVSGSLYVEVVDPDQNERPLMRELIFGGWNKDAEAGEAALPGNAIGVCPSPIPTEEEDSAPIWDLSGNEGNPDANTADLMTPNGTLAAVNLALSSISGIPATVKLVIWNAQTGNWERLDLKETGTDSGVFRSTTCVPVSGPDSLGSSPGDTIFALYQDPSNHSDIALAMIKVSEGGAGDITPPTAGLRVAFDREYYHPGEPVTITLTDPAYSSAAEIAGAGVLVVEGEARETIAGWDSIPAVAEDEFQVSFVLPDDYLGTIRARYTDPSVPGRIAETTAEVRLAELTRVSGVVPEPQVLRDGVEFVVQAEPAGAPVELLTVRVYDLTGRRVAELEGEHTSSVFWDGGSLRNGAYIYVAVVEDPALVAPQTFKGFVYINR